MTRYAVPRLLLAAWLIAGALLLSTACADQRTIVFSNHRDRPVTVHVDGDRLLIIRPFVEEGIPYATAAWAWPRTVEVREWETGKVVISFWADGTMLARHNWRVEIR